MPTLSDRMTRLICEQFKLAANQVSPDARFKEDLKVPSLNMVLLHVAMEEEFNIEVTDQDAKKIISLRTALEYLNSKGISN
jgi:acyl carrier protein